MALTTKQEEILARLITAYENGKRVTELPSASAENPFDLICEVIDKSGESKQARLAEMLPYLEEQCAYGIEFDPESLAAEVTRVGNMTLHKTLPIQNRMRGCLLDDNGKVVQYLNPKTWENEVRDGSKGQVMVETPSHYRRFYTTQEGKFRAMISEFPLPGYHFVPLQYPSAYEASMQHSTGKLSSVVNKTEDYRGGDNSATVQSWDGTYRSMLGKPATKLSLTQFREAARKRNGAATTEWNCYTYGTHKTLWWLFVIEYATRNSQAPLNAELTAEGYHQGGLGVGATDESVSFHSTYFSNLPTIPCGLTDHFGNGTGEVTHTITADDGATSTVHVNRYRGVEVPFGSNMKWTDGCLFWIPASEENGGTGKNEAWVTEDPALFNSTTPEAYRFAGIVPSTSANIKTMLCGEHGDFLPLIVAGGATSVAPIGDYWSVPVVTEGKSLRGLCLGGFSAYGAAASGLACSYSLYAPSSAPSYITSRLCFIPSA